jgi:hypothetical protein
MMSHLEIVLRLLFGVCMSVCVCVCVTFGVSELRTWQDITSTQIVFGMCVQICEYVHVRTLPLHSWVRCVVLKLANTATFSRSWVP